MFAAETEYVDLTYDPKHNDASMSSIPQSHDTPNDFSVFQAVSLHRVNGLRPATSSSGNGLDFECCSAIHYAIVQYGWFGSGHEASTLPTTTWWTRPEPVPYQQSLQQRLHPSLVNFLQRALLPADVFPDEPREYNFFYFLPRTRFPLDMSTWIRWAWGL
ncbi:hypothetical protein LTR62_008253 [Meristemomyces frigidus]|uniref:Uncharacterized protein n=1 Tax=Meristemomyces frigidus TaxID=1508187 RepID=A0AAN7YHA8_9PEZI|nr:hypothetical protein LTR62_008253 [Meristemomyces frigidus]